MFGLSTEFELATERFPKKTRSNPHDSQWPPLADKIPWPIIHGALGDFDKTLTPN